MSTQRLVLTLFVLILASLVQGCDILAPETKTFRQLRYYAAEAESVWFAYALKLCPDGRVDMVVADFGVYGTYRLVENRVLVTAGASKWRFTLSGNGNALTADEGGRVLERNRQAEIESSGCLEGVDR